MEGVLFIELMKKLDYLF